MPRQLQNFTEEDNIETFFKLLNRNINIKTFDCISENTVKLKIFVALLAYLLIDLLRRRIAKGQTSRLKFFEKIRICLSFYLSLYYEINQIKPKAKRAVPLQSNLDIMLKPTLF